MSNYKFVSIDRIFSKLVRDLGDTNIVEGDVIEWVGEALEFIGSSRYYQEAISFIEVSNYQCDLPTGLHAIIQIARNNCWSPAESLLCPKTVVEALQEENIPAVPVAIDCNGQPVHDYDVAYYRPFFDLKAEYSLWAGGTYYKTCYTPVRLANHTFFNSLVCQEDSTALYTGNDSYNIVAGKTLRFNFKEGSVAVAHLKQMLDETTGYPMIPDNISYTTAITKYVTLKIFERHFFSGREGAKGKLDKAEADWHWYCKQAGNVDLMPHGVDEYQNLLDQRSYILPRQNQYFGFFGNLAKPENRGWNGSRRRTL